MRHRSPFVVVLPLTLAVALLVYGGRFVEHWRHARHEEQAGLEAQRRADATTALLRALPLPAGFRVCSEPNVPNACWTGPGTTKQLTLVVERAWQGLGARAVEGGCRGGPLPTCMLRGDTRTGSVMAIVHETPAGFPAADMNVQMYGGGSRSTHPFPPLPIPLPRLAR